MNELIMVVVFVIMGAIAYPFRNMFVIGDELCIVPTKEKTILEKRAIRKGGEK